MNRAVAVILVALFSVASVAGGASLPKISVFHQAKKSAAEHRTSPTPRGDDLAADDVPLTLVETKSAIQDALDAANKIQKDRLEKRVIKAIADPPPPPPEPTPNPQPSPLPSPDETPTLVLPAQVEGNVGEFIEIVAQTNCKRVKWIVIDNGLNKFPERMLADPVSTVVSSQQGGKYRIAGIAAKNDEITDPVMVMVVVHGPQPPPPVPVPPIPQPPVPVPPVPIPPPPVPVNPTSTRPFIVVIDDVTKRDSRTTQVLTDMTLWNSFSAQGMQWKKINITEPDAAKFKQMIDANNGIPVIVIMDGANFVPGQSISLKWLNKSPMDLRLPATSAGLKALVDRYTSK